MIYSVRYFPVLTPSVKHHAFSLFWTTFSLLSSVNAGDTSLLLRLLLKSLGSNAKPSWRLWVLWWNYNNANCEVKTALAVLLHAPLKNMSNSHFTNHKSKGGKWSQFCICIVASFNYKIKHIFFPNYHIVITYYY